MFSNFLNWYLWYYPILAFMGFLYVNQKNKYFESVGGITEDNKDVYRVGIFFAVITFLPIILIAGFRSIWIGDTNVYVEGYKKLSSDFFDGLSQVDWHSKSPGFTVFSLFIKQVFGSDYRPWLVIIAAISGLSLALTYRRYTAEVVVCAFLFFSSTDYYGWMMNGMRQFLAVSILFACTPLLEKKKYVRFLLIGLLLITIHVSVIVALPLYFCALGKPFNRKTIAIIVLCIIVVIFAGYFLNLFDDVLSDTAYQGTITGMSKDRGTNFWHVLVYSVPAILAIVFRGKISEDAPKIIQVSVNMSLITMAIYGVSLFSSGIIVGRLPIYFSLFNYILIPWEIKAFFEKDKRTVYFIMIGLYLVYYYLQWNI